MNTVDELLYEARIGTVKRWLAAKGCTLWADFEIDSDEGLRQAAEWFVAQEDQIRLFQELPPPDPNQIRLFQDPAEVDDRSRVVHGVPIDHRRDLPA